WRRARSAHCAGFSSGTTTLLPALTACPASSPPSFRRARRIESRGGFPVFPIPVKSVTHDPARKTSQKQFFGFSGFDVSSLSHISCGCLAVVAVVTVYFPY